METRCLRVEATYITHQGSSPSLVTVTSDLKSNLGFWFSRLRNSLNQQKEQAYPLIIKATIQEHPNGKEGRCPQSFETFLEALQTPWSGVCYQSSLMEARLNKSFYPSTLTGGQRVVKKVGTF